MLVEHGLLNIREADICSSVGVKLIVQKVMPDGLKRLFLRAAA
jgi:hypothetical protein